MLYQQQESEWKKDSERYYRELLDWLRSLLKPVGVLATEDLGGARLLVACRDLNLAVPEHVGVLGKGNDEWVCKFTRPSLSSICEDYAEIGYQAAALLNRLMEGASLPVRRCWWPRDRSSAASPPT